jgi:hypothetical protein
MSSVYENAFTDLNSTVSFGGGGGKRRSGGSSSKPKKKKSIWNNAQGNDIRTWDAWKGHDLNGNGSLIDEAAMVLGIVGGPATGGLSSLGAAAVYGTGAAVAINEYSR